MTKNILHWIAAISFLPMPALAQSVENFYKGKKIDVVIGFSVGGGYDAYGRLVARHLGEHIPGKPLLIPRNMTGAGSRVAAAYIHGAAPRDGTSIGVAEQSLPLEHALGDAGIKFDPRELQWIGNPNADNNVLTVWRTSPVQTIPEAKKTPISIGATGYNTTAQYPAVLNAMIGTKFKVILGYPGGNEINLAMEREEVVGRGSSGWGAYKSQRPDWVKDKKIHVLVQIGLTKSPDLPDAPLLMDLAENELDRSAMRLLSSPTTMGRPFFAPPGVPQERVKALRAAFDSMLKSTSFNDEATKLNLDINPVSGEEMQQIVSELGGAPEQVKKRLAELLSVVEREKK